MIEGLKDIEGIEIYIPGDLENHIGTISFNLNNYSTEDTGKILSDEYGIAVRTGHHCAPLIGKFLEGHATEGTVRISVGYFNNSDDIERLINAIEEIAGGY